VRDFIASHRCTTPLFLRISEEFIAYLSALSDGQLRPFEAELAHYEWLELAVDVAEGEPAEAAAQDPADSTVAALAPTARLASYRYPVHRIGPTFQPTAPGDATHLLVYRTRTQNVRFMELTPATTRLLLEASRAGSAVRDVTHKLAAEWGMEPGALTSFAWEQLRDLNDAGAVTLRAPSGA